MRRAGRFPTLRPDLQPLREDVPLEARFLSNEKHTVAKFSLSNDGQWHRHEVDVSLDFDLSVTELFAVFFRAMKPCDELSFRNLSLVKSCTVAAGMGM